MWTISANYLFGVKQLKNEQIIQDHALEIYDDDTALQIEDTLWWIQGRKFIIRKYLDALTEESIEHIVDIGCGSGGNLSVLAEYGVVSGIEISPKLAMLAEKRKLGQIICGDFFEVGFSAHIDIYTLFDVLEHIEDDNKFINKITRSDSAPHSLLISVPAMPSLYSQHDELLHHHRRYTHKTLCRVLENNGYEIVSMSYFMTILLPLVFLSRLSEKVMSLFGRKKQSVTLGQAPTWLNFLLISILRFEAFLSNWLSFPAGVWLFALAKHPGTSGKPVS